MIRYIPGKTRVKTEFFRNITFGDIIIAIVCLIFAIVIIASNLFKINGFDYRWYALFAWIGISVVMYLPIDQGLRLWSSITLIIRFSAFAKKYINNASGKKKGYKPMTMLTPFFKIDIGKFIDFGSYSGMVLELHPVALELMQEKAQDSLIHTFSKALKRMSQYQRASIVKTVKPMRFDIFLKSDDTKYALLNELYEQGQYSDNEMESRGIIFRERVDALNNAIKAEPILQNHFYLVIYGEDRTNLEETAIGIMNDLGTGQYTIASNILKENDLISFLKSNYQSIYSEQEIQNLAPSQYSNWIMPQKVEFKVARVDLDKRPYKQMVIANYPLEVGNGWAYPIFNQEGTRVIMNIMPVDKEKGEKAIDRAVMEKEAKLDRTFRSSELIEKEADIESLQTLLKDLKTNNEQLYDVSIHLRVEEQNRKEVRNVLKQYGFKYSDLFGRQVDAFVSSSVNRIDTLEPFYRSMPSTTIAASFPMVDSIMQDPAGFCIGTSTSSGYPVFIDFFTRDSRAGRINSNMMVIGKSGSGKSYATKTILTNLAADRTKMFILDPEQEYDVMTLNLGGKVIDVGTNKSGILNPFHIMASLEDLDSAAADMEDVEGEDIDELVKKGTNKTFFTHLQFLEQFFRAILEGISSDAFETLNTIIVELYNKKGINQFTNIGELKAEDYPIFDDLFALIKEKLKTVKDAYYRQNLLILETYIQKFATGGRNSDLWNGPTSILTDENLITFNFQTLFASKNNKLANAQMLLVFKYLNNEIINNKKFNADYYAKTGNDIKRQVVIAVDEAHMFIDPDSPVALNFMAEMAKRIRKYQGMQIVITQNIKDFLGTPEIQRRSAAIINACQYSMILQLAPNDMADLLELYKSAGGINETEQEGIVTAPRGRAFFITSPMDRSFIDITAMPNVVEIMGEGRRK
ncbi:MAG: ATP-binding protein [Clostridia bacterium]|nr:ATP-binding protein [Clostridia bacterium]